MQRENRFGSRAAWALVFAACLVPLAGCKPQAQAPAAVFPGPVPVLFRDVAREAGVTFRHENGASPNKYFVEVMGAGVALFDYDRDDRVDLLFVNGRSLAGNPSGATLKLYRNETPLPSATPPKQRTATNPSPPAPPPVSHPAAPIPRFRDVTAGAGLGVTLYGMGCAVADYDGDGWPDVYVSGVLDGGRLFHNERGRFRDVTATAGVGHAGRWGTGCAWLDYDHDGRPDLYVASYVRYRSLQDDQPCMVQPGRRSYCVPISYDGSSGALYRNLGEGRFRDVTAEAGLADSRQKALGLVAQDLDGNGWTDLAVANDTVPNRLFLNEEGHFREAGAALGFGFGPTGKARAGMGLAAGDWRRDGTATLAITNFSQEKIGWFVPLPGGELAYADDADNAGIGEPSRPFLGFGIQFADLDNDGFLDVCAVNGHIRDDIAALEPGQSQAQPALIFRNLFGARFEDLSPYCGPPVTTPAVRRGLALGDLNNDGRLDVVTTCNGGPAEVWLNDTPPLGHWLSVRIEDNPPNRDALGARVTLRAGGHTQTHWVTRGGSYLSESDRRLHWGLGAAKTYDSLSVHWPDGTEETFPGGDGDRRMTLTRQKPAPPHEPGKSGDRERSTQ